MPAVDKINALRGLRDINSAEFAQYSAIQQRLESHLRLHGYRAMDLPILENTELYLRKSGEDIAARLYEFDFKSRRISLRPEFTASILRAYVERLHDEPLPLRIQYSGPVFRYEKPQQHRYRQFTLAGVELLGAKGPRADAEILHLACSGLERLGISEYTLTIGHSALLEDFLNRLGLRKQLFNFLLRNMENLRKHGADEVLAALKQIYPELANAVASADESQASGDKSQQLVNVLRKMNEGEAHQAVADFLHSLNIRIAGGRDESEVIERLLRKIREDQQAPKVRLALEFMSRLAQLAGAPEQVLPAARALAEAYDLERDALDSLDEALACLDEHGERRGQTRLDFGMNRGLHYYTGLIFELHGASMDGETIQLCGGGRYDNLVSILGGSEATPALGFAYGIERLAGALPDLSKQGAPVLVIPVGEADYGAANAIAANLRAHEIAAEISLDARGLRRSLKRANRRGADLVIIMGEDEGRQNAAILRDMVRREERLVPLDELAAAAREWMSAHE